VRKKAVDAIRLPEAPAEGTLPDVATLEAKLAGLRTEAQALRAERSEESGRRKELDRQVTHAEGELTRLTQKRGTLLTAVGLEGARLDLDDAILELEEASAKTALTDLETEAADAARLSLVDAGGRLRMLEETIAQVQAHTPERGCVLNAAIECRTPAKAFAGEVKALQQQIVALREQQDAASKTVETMRLRTADQAGRDQRLAVLVQQRRDRDAVTADITTLQESLRRLRSERDQTAAAATEANPELVELEARIAKGEAVVRDVHEEAHRRKAYEASRRAQLEATRALVEAERQVELYGPNGARVPALKAALEAFHVRINEALVRFGYELHIVPDPWMVLVNGRSAALLSQSERLQAGIALQLAIAEISGFGFVAIDQVDLFDAENRRKRSARSSMRRRSRSWRQRRSDDSFDPPPNEGWSMAADRAARRASARSCRAARRWAREREEARAAGGLGLPSPARRARRRGASAAVHRRPALRGRRGLLAARAQGAADRGSREALGTRPTGRGQHGRRLSP
jgi:hypothetical protein